MVTMVTHTNNLFREYEFGQYECHCGLEFTDSSQLTQRINSTHSGGV